MMRRFAQSAHTLVCGMLPRYANALEWGRTSFRPIGIEGRETSTAKDDTLLHVDVEIDDHDDVAPAPGGLGRIGE